MRRRSPWHNAAELRDILSELIDIDWTDPGWWALVGGGSALDSYARARALVRRKPRPAALPGGGASRDAWVCRDRAVAPTTAERIARAVAMARAAINAIAELDGQLPDQPLRCHVVATKAGHRRVFHASSRRRVVFVLPSERFIASVLPDPRSDVELARQLARALAMQHQPPLNRLTRLAATPAEATPAGVAVSLCDEHINTGRHVHRRAWSRRGGPWLGVGWAGSHELVSASRGIVATHGHLRIATTLFRQADHQGDFDLLAGAARAELPARMNLFRLPPAGAEALGIATQAVDHPLPSATTLAYATGSTVAEFYPGRERSRFSPVFQVPLTAATRAIQERARRPGPGLLSLAIDGSSPESYRAFQSRIEPLLDRQRGARALLTRLVDNLAKLPSVGPLRARSCLDVAQLSPSELPAEPVFTASRPPVSASQRDHLGGSVISVVPTRAGYTVCVSGTGFAGTDMGAQRMLDRFVEQLHRMRTRSQSNALQSEA